MPHATLPSPGLQAIILCGPGVSLNTFTANPAEFPKALVPIANRPMVWYPLDFCYRMGINDITLITPPESESSLQAALDTNPALTSLPNPKPEVIAPADLTQTTGTAEILRLSQVQKCITSDFVVLPCDLISELDGTRLIQQWMTLNDFSGLKDSNRRRGGLGVYYPTQGLDTISHKKDETDFIATVKLPSSPVPSSNGSVRQQVEQLVMAMPTDTLKDVIDEDKDKSLKIRASLFDQFPNVKLRMKHRDAHFYILPEWIKEFAARNDTFESLSEDMLGWWSKSAWQIGLRQKLKLDEVLSTKPPKGMDESMDNAEEYVDVSSLSTTKTSAMGHIERADAPQFASRMGSAAPESLASTPVHVPPILAYVQPPPSASGSSQPLIRRVDTSHQLLNVSLYLAKQTPEQPLAHEHKVHPTAQVGQQSRISQEDSLVAENVTIGTRVNIKESVIGANCTVGSGARLTRCLLMEGVYVGEGVQLTSCIIGKRARIEGMKPAESASVAAEGAEGGKKQRKKGGDDEDRTRLTECEVAPQFVVEAGTEAKGEKLMAFDTEGMSDEEFAEEDMGDEDVSVAS